ncbi:3-isopropylmalate dehydratase small subunit [Spiribacter vilamensis]|uniref:3-isopropylmalate dehydratase small subunit n=1 Tax=Spiribacter vilamensis TaxID=531306 RepID=A0A4Q8CYL1_9GAMM|nr:3-isopropylmalate dehydratase small subunit [Spiribacter vilamensis]RZU97980.1 3-isopropylmalate dehydratase small subunit [Spiribacter vilamensis]TVO61107.1 3-isopropylmalate dehydratase small subunit [Spiribacter vilamensis]
MEPLTRVNGLVAPLDRSNVDTDAIIPKQFLKSIHRTGFGPNLFDEWRYLDEGQPGQDCSDRPINHDFVLNQSRYGGASILLTRANFGCGSSREHAPWALADFGFRVLIAPSFADIFYNNCSKNGILPLTLPAETVQALFEATWAQPGYSLTVDLPSQSVTTPDGTRHEFEIDPHRKHMLVEGLDEIGVTLKHAEEIRAYEQRQRQVTPWLFADVEPT